MPLITQAPKPAINLHIAGKQDVRIVFFGTPSFAVPALRALHKAGWPITGVVTAPDKPLGRRMVLTPSPVKSAALELGLQVISPTSLKNESFANDFKNFNADVCIVVAYGKLIPQSILEKPRLGFLNIHPSLLPLYRGPSPIQTAILDGLTETGVSIMLLDAQMDHGPVLTQQKWAIPGGADLVFCEEELSRLGADLLKDTLPGYIAGTVKPVEQDHSKATICKKFEREDGRINWHQPAKNIHDRIRALGGNPGTWTMWDGKTLNIFHAHIADGEGEPGKVLIKNGELAVACGGGLLVIETLQLQGGNRMSARDFLNGRSAIVGSVLI